MLCATGRSQDAFATIGSMRNELELPHGFPHHKAREDADGDSMMLGSTPKFGSPAPRSLHRAPHHPTAGACNAQASLLAT